MEPLPAPLLGLKCSITSQLDFFGVVMVWGALVVVITFDSKCDDIDVADATATVAAVDVGKNSKDISGVVFVADCFKDVDRFANLLLFKVFDKESFGKGRKLKFSV